MKTFIDESGTFSGIGGAKKPSVVGALIIPDRDYDEVIGAYRELRNDLPKNKGEVKGKQLSAAHVASVVELLRRFPILFEATAIDLGLHTKDGLEHHRKMQAEGITRSVPNLIHQRMKDDLCDLRSQLESMSLQLYVQSVASFELIHRIGTLVPLFYAQRIPKELGQFEWVIDAKDRSNPITPWEKWWSVVLLSMLQSKSARSPMIMMEGADWSYFERFMTDWEDWAFPGVQPPDDRKAVDVKRIMTEYFRFSDLPEPGLELVDILTNAVRRALIGNLERIGWGGIPRLMIHRPQHYIQVISMQDVSASGVPYRDVLSGFARDGRLMLTEENLRTAAAERR